MKKIDASIEIVSSANASLSSMSQESREALRQVLTKTYSDVIITLVSTLLDLEALVDRKPDLVFLGMNFIPTDADLGIEDPNKIWLSSYFDINDIAYTGSSQFAHQLERNKPLAKQRILDAGLQTAAFVVFTQKEQIVPALSSIDFPVFIKPTNRGGGLGIDSHSVAYNHKQLCTKVFSISTNLHADSLIEEYLPGREFSVAVLKKENSADYSVLPIELIAKPDKKGVRMLSKQIKSSNAERAITINNHKLKKRISTFALDVFRALGARDYGRIDIRLDQYGVPQFLEANLIPSLISGYGSFPKACLLNKNMNYEAMILSIVKLGLARSLRNHVHDYKITDVDSVVLPNLEPVL